MYKKSMALILLLSSIMAFSQEMVNLIPLELKKNRDVFQIVNNTTKETSLFISDKKRVKAIRLNDKMQIIDSLSTERPDKTYSEMIGYNNDQSNPRLFWISSNHKEIFSQLYNFENQQISNQNYTLSLKNEKFLQKFSENGKFYILTIIRDSNTIKLYVFDEHGKMEERIIALTGFHFFDSNYQRTNLYGVLEENLLPFESSFSLQKITTESPTSLTESAKKRKCYSNDNQIILTFDCNFDYTQLITIDLKKYTAVEKIIKKPFIKYADRFELKSNSFLIDDRLFQIKLNSEKMIVTSKDLEDNLIKEYTADKEGQIDFKNSEIIQENGSASSIRILEKTSQFLRKVNSSNPGISCYKVNGNYLVTLGSISEQQQNSAIMIGAMVGGLSGALIAVAISNPTYDSFNSYSKRKVVYINCLFDKDNNHINGESKPLAFDNIRKFLDEKTSISSQTIYKLDHSYYLGYYDDTRKEYALINFAE
jgi:hypothetical protein